QTISDRQRDAIMASNRQMLFTQQYMQQFVRNMLNQRQTAYAYVENSGDIVVAHFDVEAFEAGTTGGGAANDSSVGTGNSHSDDSESRNGRGTSLDEENVQKRDNNKETDTSKLRNFGESLWDNITDLRLNANAGAAFGGLGANLSASREIDGDNPSVRAAWASGLGAFGGAMLEGSPISFGEIGDVNQSVNLSIGVGFAAQLTIKWSHSGFQFSSAIGGGFGLKANIVDFGYSKDL
ncbi:hypothetical protein, partial [Marinimicrobium sp. ARAG 43.8]|uniref:hypothetical protein n=1 Tax=Marinimicrobium sp. ARAG 43.8 TaxID=3418719 RepID=UPI003CE92D80